MGENVCKLGKRLIFTVRYEELLHLKIKWLITKKMGKGFSQRSSINGSKAHEEEFNINSYSAVPQKLNTSYHARALSRVQVFVTPWTVACWAPLSKGFSRQEYWSGLPCLPPGDLPHPGIEPTPLYVSCIGRQVLAISTTWEAQFIKTLWQVYIGQSETKIYIANFDRVERRNRHPTSILHLQ